MSKISELSDGGALQSTDYLIAVRSGGNVKVQPNGTVTGTTGSFSGNVTFADNAKAIFGAGSDLQIYHNGTNSFIQEQGTGDLYITTNGSKIEMMTNGLTEYGVRIFQDGEVSLYHNGSAKLATTATGIDVTGNTLSDSLTANGSLSALNAGSVMLDYNGSSVSRLLAVGADATTTGTLKVVSTASDGGPYIEALTVNSTGIDVTGTVTADGLTVDGSSSGRVVLGTFSNTTNAAGTEAAIELRNSATNLCDVSLVASRVAANFGSDFYIETSDGVDGTNRKRLNIGENGDVSLYEETGTTPKFFWDASAEALGLGTTSPDYGIDLRAAVSNGLRVGSSGNTFGSLLSWDNASGLARLESLGAYPLVLGTNSTERLRITSAGDVGIGTTSPSVISGFTVLALNNATNGGVVDFEQNETSVAQVYGSGNGLGLSANGASRWIQFNTNGTEKARLDASGNLLVGKSTSDLGATAGIELNGQYDVGYFTRSAEKALVVNRLSTDGSIVDFRKDGTTVGSIGSQGGSNLYIEDADAGLRFSSSSDEIAPCGSAGANRDNAITLGASNNRFKDLYLSGGVYLGGTGAANLLDDYETGTWTPTLGGTWTTNPTSLSGTYTKIGRLVHIQVKMTGGVKSTAISGYLEGVPISIVTEGTGSVSDSSVADHGNCLFANTDRIWVTDTNLGTGTIYISGCYLTT